jgi:hypothetical protein
MSLEKDTDEIKGLMTEMRMAISEIKYEKKIPTKTLDDITTLIQIIQTGSQFKIRIKTIG